MKIFTLYFSIIFCTYIPFVISAQQVDTIKMQLFDANGKYNAVLFPDIDRFNPTVEKDFLRMELPRGVVNYTADLKIHVDTAFWDKYDSVWFVPYFDIKASDENYFKSRIYSVAPLLLDSLHSITFDIRNFDALHSYRVYYVKLCKNCSSVKIDTTLKVRLSIGNHSMDVVSEGYTCLKFGNNNYDCSFASDPFWNRNYLRNYYFYPDSTATQLQIRKDFCEIVSKSNSSDAFKKQEIYNRCFDSAHVPSAIDLKIRWAFKREVHLWCFKKCAPLNASVTQNGNTLVSDITASSYTWLDCNNNLSPIPNSNKKSYTPSTNGSYAVKINQSGCKDTSACVNVTTVGIDNDVFNNITISPNPTYKTVNIGLGELKNVSIKVYNVAGQMIHQNAQIPSNAYQFEINEKPGIYTVELANETWKRNFLIVKLDEK